MPRLSKIGAAALAAFGWTAGATVSADFLVIAGGGAGGGSNMGGGGGAGGYRTSSGTSGGGASAESKLSLNLSLSYSVIVGAGGTGNGGQGSDSVFSTITSTGGGGGVTYVNSGGTTGGSGGGGSIGSGKSGTSNQGYAGGSGQFFSVGAGSGGGGGAGAVGGNSGTNDPGPSGSGGAGVASSITGSSVTRGGGGGGAAYPALTDQPGSGGSGGGGAGAPGGAGASATVGTAGTANTGGGGGGSQQATGANGGSGVVIISYTSATQLFGGGTVTQSGGNVIHTFNTSGTLSPLSSVTASYLVVAGGGGGGTSNGSWITGGGGAGGLLSGSGLILDSNSIYTVTVGAGGAAETNGSNSLFSMVTTTAVGGGRAFKGTPSGSGGSGGGSSLSAGTETFGTGTSGQGNNGGTAASSGAGGGGGAGAVGGNGSASGGGNGGAGIASSISGSSVTYAGGGGGGAASSTGSAGTGGSGGGGAGALGNNVTATAGTANTGGGGGGNGQLTGVGTGGTGGAGGSGVVIISYAGSTQQMAGGTVTISGGNVIHTFTSSGYLTPIKYVNNSLRFRSSASAYLNRTPATASNRKTYTFSCWAKRGSLSSNQNIVAQGNNEVLFRFNTTDNINFADYTGGSAVWEITSSSVYRDPSAWYHIVFAIDTTQATSSNRVKVWINNSQVTFTGTYPTLNSDTPFNTTNAMLIGNRTGVSQYFDGYLTEINFIDGQALTPNSFGTFNSYGVWQPITYGGSYGTNGFYLPFTNKTSTTTLGYDFSPNGNNWTTNNISLTAGSTYDSMTDVPTLTSATAANYCVLNPLFAGTSSYLTNGNLNASVSATNTSLIGTIQIPTSGKWYWEYQITTIGGGSNPMGGIATTSASSPAVFYRTNGDKLVDGTGSAYGATYTTTDTIGVAVDVDGGTVAFYKNNTSQGNITYASSGFFPALRSSAGTDIFNINFGQRPFSYTPPTGFVALNTYNLPASTITNGAAYMAATLYTGNGTSQTITNAGGFAPDLVWIKGRSYVDSHTLFDTVRGATKSLSSNTSTAEVTRTTALTAFTSTGFTVSSDTLVNYNANTLVGWQWKAGGTAVSNTDGTITTTVSANPSSGFSVMTYTGTGIDNKTIGHGLGAAPKFIIWKPRASATDWMVWHAGLSGYNYDVRLNTTAAQGTGANPLNNTAPSSTVITLRNQGDVNGSGTTIVCYCWAAVAGYSAFGSYTGNGSTDGPFVYLGFRPRFVLIKISSGSTGSWYLLDSSRDTYNVASNTLFPDLSNAEGTGANFIDFLSNGFKLRNAGGSTNGSGFTFIYACFAENPFKYANAR